MMRQEAKLSKWAYTLYSRDDDAPSGHASKVDHKFKALLAKHGGVKPWQAMRAQLEAWVEKQKYRVPA